MAVSEVYLIRFLVQATEDAQDALQWRSGESSEFRAEVNGVRLGLFHVHSVDGSHLCLRLSNGEDRTFIEEPRSVSIFGGRYRTEEERSLAESMQALAECVARQCAHRNTRAWDLRDSIREGLYRQVLFGTR